MSAPSYIDVCICTFRREAVSETIDSLLRQSSGHPPFRILVADNDDVPSARERVEAFRDRGVELAYIHAPARNISLARNACLDAACGDYVAFLDDDQIAEPAWLDALYRTALESGADVVLGPVHAIYPPGSPPWARNGEFHSTFPVIRPNDAIETGYTGNVLMKRASVGALRFSLELGRTGGEDTVFFHHLRKAGARIVYAPAALMREFIPATRVSLQWLLRRSYRSGQTHARLISLEGKSPALVFITSLSKLGACLALAAINIRSETAWRRALVRGMLHAGVISTLFGRREAETYGQPAI